MSASAVGAIRAEPNLTPLLDVVFQLITFFMLVINFSRENYDQRIKLPVAGSARPIEEGEKVAEDRFVLNLDRDGHLLFNGEVQLPHQAGQTIRHEADLIKLNMKAIGTKPDPSGGLPTTVEIRADKDLNYGSLQTLLNLCQNNGFHKFAFKAMTGP
jgi:biopolymer transport protein ExbD